MDFFWFHAVLFEQHSTIGGQKNMNAIYPQKDPCCEPASKPIERRESNVCVREIDVLKKGMKRNVSVVAQQGRKRGYQRTRKCRERPVAHGRQPDLNQNHTRKNLGNSANHVKNVKNEINLPAAWNTKPTNPRFSFSTHT